MVILMMVLTMVGCSTLDCPLNNTTYTKYKLMGNIKTLQDTMTISTTKTAGTDSVLINKDVKVDSFILPMSYHQPEDVFYFEIRNRDASGVERHGDREEGELFAFRVCGLRSVILPYHYGGEDHPQLHRLDSHQQ